MLHKTFGITVLCCLAALYIQASQDQAEKTDKEQLQGTWIMVSVEKDGKKVETPADKQTLMTFTGDKATFKSEKRNDDGTFKIDAAKKPKEIDLINPKADNKEMETIRAIYELTGDTLRMAFPAKREAARPASFDAKEIVILTLKRNK
jgi:uncharacterized protein (TIGR03067 family)